MTASFDIKTTEAQHYRRFLLQQETAMTASSQERFPHQKTVDSIGRAPRGLNDGKGFLFVSHTGEVFPSGFPPVSAGIPQASRELDQKAVAEMGHEFRARRA
jgi:AdoMet-dependent heme synthase